MELSEVSDGINQEVATFYFVLIHIGCMKVHQQFVYLE